MRQTLEKTYQSDTFDLERRTATMPTSSHTPKYRRQKAKGKGKQDRAFLVPSGSTQRDNGFLIV